MLQFRHENICNKQSPLDYTIPRTTVALKLTSSPAKLGLGMVWPSACEPAPTLSVSELLFHPQLWLMAKSSGELLKRVWAVPVPLAQHMVKYAFTDDRGSRYGCDGTAGCNVAGRVRPDVLG